jgi:hypothetical protein
MKIPIRSSLLVLATLAMCFGLGVCARARPAQFSTHTTATTSCQTGTTVSRGDFMRTMDGVWLMLLIGIFVGVVTLSYIKLHHEITRRTLVAAIKELEDSFEDDDSDSEADSDNNKSPNTTPKTPEDKAFDAQVDAYIGLLIGLLPCGDINVLLGGCGTLKESISQWFQSTLGEEITRVFPGTTHQTMTDFVWNFVRLYLKIGRLSSVKVVCQALGDVLKEIGRTTEFKSISDSPIFSGVDRDASRDLETYLRVLGGRLRIINDMDNGPLKEKVFADLFEEVGVSAFVPQTSVFAALGMGNMFTASPAAPEETTVPDERTPPSNPLGVTNIPLKGGAMNDLSRGATNIPDERTPPSNPLGATNIPLKKGAINDPLRGATNIPNKRTPPSNPLGATNIPDSIWMGSIGDMHTRSYPFPHTGLDGFFKYGPVSPPAPPPSMVPPSTIPPQTTTTPATMPPSKPRQEGWSENNNTSGIANETTNPFDGVRRPHAGSIANPIANYIATGSTANPTTMDSFVGSIVNSVADSAADSTSNPDTDNTVDRNCKTAPAEPTSITTAPMTTSDTKSDTSDTKSDTSEKSDDFVVPN